MKLFLDTSDITAIQELLPTGLIDGITTNPTNLSSIGTDPVGVIKNICALLPDKPISVEVTAKQPDDLYKQARKIAGLAPNVVVKIPCAIEYYPIIQQLVHEGILVNITLIFSLAQAAIIGKLGVAYISPFIGRLEETGVAVFTVLHNICALRDHHQYTSKILAASIRTIHHLEMALTAGTDCITISPALLKKATEHALTTDGIAQFDSDWSTLQKISFP